MTFVAFMLLLLFGAKANAQSDVRTPEQKIYFPQMDPVLGGMWAGNGDGAGMRYDAEAIACMMRACAIIQASVPQNTERCRNSTDPNCRYTEVRDSRNSLYQACYSAHLARVQQPGYTRLANPPAMTSLVCSVIAAQSHSADEAIFTAVNGHPRPKPPARIYAAATPPRVALDPGEAEVLLAELDGIDGQTRLAPAARPHNVKAGHAKRASAATSAPRYGEYPHGFRVVSQDDKETAFLVLPGADYHALEHSSFAETHETNSVKVMAYAGNDRAQVFFPYHLTPGKIELYKPRLRLAGNDVKGRLGPIDADTRAFIRQCDNGSCETRFALQAGEIIRLPRKSASSAISSATPEPPAPPKTGANDTPPPVVPDMEYVDTADASANFAGSSLASVPPNPSNGSSPAASVPSASIATLETVNVVPRTTDEGNVIQPLDSTPDASVVATAEVAPKPAAISTGTSLGDGIVRHFFWIILLAGTGLLAVLIGYARHRHKEQNPEEEAEVMPIPATQRVPNHDTAPPGTPPNSAISESQPISTTLRPASGVAPPAEPANQAGTFTPVPSAQVSQPKSKVVILMPGSSGPNEPTVLTGLNQNQPAATGGSSGSTATGGPSPPKASSGST